MTNPDQPAERHPIEHTNEEMRHGYLQRKRQKISEEIERNRRGEYTVPTWVLALALVVLVAGWAALVFLA
jgi:hypothetical protein